MGALLPPRAAARAWEDHRDVLVVDPARSAVVRAGTAKTSTASTVASCCCAGESRRVAFGVGAELFVLYDSPAPFPRRACGPARAPGAVRVLDVLDDGLLVEERRSPGSWSELPMAVVPGTPPPAGRQREAILEWAQALSSSPVRWPRNRRSTCCAASATHARRRRRARAPHARARLRAGGHRLAARARPLLPRGPGAARHRQDLRRVARDHRARRAPRLAHRRRRAVARGGREHARGGRRAGLDPDLVAKAPKDAREPGDHGYTIVTKHGVAEFSAAHAASGFVVGGTAWDFANADRCPPLARPAGHRRSRPVLAGRHDRLGVAAATCCSSATRSSCRR